MILGSPEVTTKLGCTGSLYTPPANWGILTYALSALNYCTTRLKRSYLVSSMVDLYVTSGFLFITHLACIVIGYEIGLVRK